MKDRIHLKNGRKTDMDKKEQFWEILAWGLLAAVLLLLAALNVFWGDHWIDSDMAAEMIFSRLLAQEGKWIATENWYYSTEFRVLYTQLIMTPLFHVLGDWHVIRVLTNVITYLLMLGAYFYCMKPFGIRRSTVVFSSVILLLPFSETFLTHMQMGNTYMWHVLLIMLIFGMFLRLSQPWEGKRAGRILTGILYAALSVVCGLSGVRYMLALQVPLCITAGIYILKSSEFALLRKEFSMEQTWQQVRRVLSGERWTYLCYSLLGLLGAGVGYLVNVAVLGRKFRFQMYDVTNFIKVFQGVLLERTQDTVGNLLQLFGYIEEKGFLSVRGLISMLAFGFLAGIVFLTVRCSRLLAGEWGKLAARQEGAEAPRKAGDLEQESGAEAPRKAECLEQESEAEAPRKAGCLEQESGAEAPRKAECLEQESEAEAPRKAECLEQESGAEAPRKAECLEQESGAEAPRKAECLEQEPEAEAPRKAKCLRRKSDAVESEIKRSVDGQGGRPIRVAHSRLVLWFFVTTFVLNTFVFLFTTSTIVARYYITVFLFVLPLLCIYYEYEKLPLDRMLLALILCGALGLTTAKCVYSYIDKDKNEDKRPVAAYLEEQGYTFGYASYWNGNIITELTDGQVEVANIHEIDKMDMFTWSSPVRYYQEGYHDGKTFILLTDREAAKYAQVPVIAAGEVVYDRQGYVVLHYDSMEELWQILYLKMPEM